MLIIGINRHLETIHLLYIFHLTSNENSYSNNMSRLWTSRVIIEIKATLLSNNVFIGFVQK